MSWTQQRTTESWNNDPNKFQNLNGPDAGFHDGLQQEGGRGSFFPGGNQNTRPTHDPTDTSTWGTDPTGRRQHQGEWEQNGPTGGNADMRRGHPVGENLTWGAGRGENHGGTGTIGNTTDANTFGASSDQYSSGVGPRGGVREGDNWHTTEDSAPREKPSKLQANIDKLADRLAGRH